MKIKFLIVFCIFVSNFVAAKSWNEIFNEKQVILQDPIYAIIKEQLAVFAQGKAPTIAVSHIKNIPIQECNEPVIDVRTHFHPRIEMMFDSAIQKPFSDPQCNSGMPSASKMRAAVYKKFERMIAHLDELAPTFGYAPGTISIKIFEGLRSLESQKMLFDNKCAEIKAQNPLLTNEEAETETAKWVSPYKNNVPVHSTGAAVDIRLWNNVTNEFIDLGKFGTIWGTNPSAPTFSENISDEQKLNRLFLLMAATKAGLINYCFEFWHFSSGDRYAAFWQEKDENKRSAIYGALN